MDDRNEKLVIKLNSGREVLVKSFVFEPTIDWTNDPWLGDETAPETISRCRRRVHQMLGEPRHHLIRPTVSEDGSLPDFCVTAWLSSGPIIGSKAPYSTLTVLFYSDFDRRASFKEFFEGSVAELDWDRLAYPPEDW